MKYELRVKGMMCHGCEKRVINALESIGCVNVIADHEKEYVSCETEKEEKVIIEVIEDTGFDVVK